MQPLHSRIDLACEQLDVAIELFLVERSFVSSLTLAGAAEEIFGNEVENRGGRNTLSLRHDQHIRLVRRFKNSRFSPKLKVFEKEKKPFRTEMNYARNAAKHIVNKKFDKEPYDKFFRAYPKPACITMIHHATTSQSNRPSLRTT